MYRLFFLDSVHMLNFSFEYDIEIKKKYDEGISRPLYLPHKPPAGLPNLVRLSLQKMGGFEEKECTLIKTDVTFMSIKTPYQ
jgi:hypothetical protein